MSRKSKTTATKEEATPALVPKRRFPDFQDDWEMTPIGEKVDLLSGYPFDGPDICEDKSGVRLLRGTNITEGRIRHSPEIDRYYTGETEGLEKFRVRLNDLVIGMDGSKVGKNSSLISHDDAGALLIQRVARLRTSSPTLIQFIFQQINSTTFHSYVDKINTSSGIPHISAKQIKEFTIGFPSPAEQQKIAECLSSVDELMAAQARKEDALKTHKKGLMQQLFPREGETQPRLRFPEFRDAGEWVQKTVGDVSEVLMCKRIFAEETNPTGGVPFYKIGTLGGLPDAFISREQFEDYKRRYNFPRKGEVLITCSGTVGKCLPFDGKDAYFQDSNIVWLDNPKGEVSNEFLLMLLSNVNWGRLNSTTITRIYGPDLRGLAIKFPKDDKEQQRIATCLSNLDALINAETQTLEALKTHKKGLMQQLFPSPEEVAG
jgi:type I restriction enzyme, S subunit